MQELWEQILGYLKGIWNNRWYAMAIAWLICLIAWSVIFVLPDKYESRAKIYIDTQSLLRPLLKGLTVQTNLDQQVNLMVKTLLTRPNVEKIIRLADLDLQVETDAEFDELVKHLQEDIKFHPTRRTKNVYELSYEAKSPETAREVLQAVITVFIENSIGESKEESISALKFLDKQIKDYEKRLSEAENRLKDFKQKNMGLLPSSGRDYYARMEDTKNSLEEARLLLKEAKRKQSAIKKELANIIATLKSSGADSQIVTTYDERIETLNKSLDDMLLNYTENHPDVVSTKRLLEGLKEKRQQEINDIKSHSKSATSSLELNPVYQELKITLGSVNAEVESMEVRVAEYQARYEQLRKLVNTIPEIEAQLAALNRDYNITKEKYEEFLDRKESASIAKRVDQTTESVQFKVLEAPRVENIPVGPNRVLLSSLALLLGIGGGVGFAFLLSQLKPVVMSPKQISQIVGLPVFGSVMAVVSPAQKKRRTMLVISYMSLFILLILSYAFLMVWYLVFSSSS